MILKVPIYVSCILLIFVFLVFFVLYGFDSLLKKSPKATANSIKPHVEPAQVSQNEDINQAVNSRSHTWHDVVEDTIKADGEKSYVVIRQFKTNQRLIIKIDINDSKITKISLYAAAHYKITCFSDSSFEFTSLIDFFQYAELADRRLYECLLPVIDKGDKVTAEELAKAILLYFDNPDYKVIDMLGDWVRRTAKTNISYDYKCYIAKQKSGTYNPVADMNVNVYVEYTDEFLLGIIVFLERCDTERPALFKIREELYVVDACAAMTLQKLLGDQPENIYDILVDKYSPFSSERIADLKAYLNTANIDYEFCSERVLKVSPKELWHKIPVYNDLNPDGNNGEYVAYGTHRDMCITVSYIEDIILKVEFEDSTSTSGYWHDNPNYPFTDISSKTVSVNQSIEIIRLAEALQVTDVTASSLMEKMKSQFTDQDAFIAFLDSHKINYELNSHK